MKPSRKKSFFLYLCFSMVFSNILFATPGFEEPWGKDEGLAYHRKSDIPPVPHGFNPFTKTAEVFINFHQHFLSPIDGPRSHFRPTSSQYMRLAMKRHGFLKGFIMGCDRLLRENKEEWVYRKKVFDGVEYKWDPTFTKAKQLPQLNHPKEEYLSLDEIADAIF